MPARSSPRRALADAGCFALVAEAVPAPVTAAIRHQVAVAVIGIGSGPADGQVLVLHHLAGMSTGPTPRFVKPFGVAARRDGGGGDGVRRRGAIGCVPWHEHT